jgi:hypothetical protein
MKTRQLVFVCKLAALFLILSAASLQAFNVPPVIESVQFTGSPGNYTVTVTGLGFGALSQSLPFHGDTKYFRMADAAQAVNGEWGYTGDSNSLTYHFWSNTTIKVMGFGGQPGDAITIAVWNPLSGEGATWGGEVPTPSIPHIASVDLSNTGKNLQIVVNGSGFGNAPVAMPFTGGLKYFSFTDFRSHCGAASSEFVAGFKGWGATGSPGSVTLKYKSWKDSKIVIEGFGGSYGQGCATVKSGDPVAINVWNTSDQDCTEPQTAWGGDLP